MIEKILLILLLLCWLIFFFYYYTSTLEFELDEFYEYVSREEYLNSKEYLDSEEYKKFSNSIPEEYRFPNYHIAYRSIDIEYKGHKGTVMVLNNDFEDGKHNLKVYFLSNNNKELNKAYELYTYQYGDQKLLSISSESSEDEETGDRYISILLKDTLKPNFSYSYSIVKLPLSIKDNDRSTALYSIDDDGIISIEATHLSSFSIMELYKQQHPILSLFLRNN